MPQIKINGLNIEVATEGQGRDVVLLHGWRQRMIMMEPIYNHLKAHFRVFNFDFPGFGKSDEPPVAWGVPEYREFLEAFCQTFDIHDPILIGHSFGCRVAVHYAVKNPVHKMVLTGAAGIRPKQTWQAKLKIAGYKAAKKAITLVGSEAMLEDFKRKSGSDDYRSATGIMRETFVKVVNDDVSGMLEDVTVPVLLVWGENDEAAPLWMGKQMEAKMKNAGLAIFEGDDHFAYFNQSARFNRCLDVFLKEDWEE